MRWFAVVMMLALPTSQAAGDDGDRCTTNSLPSHLAQDKCVCNRELAKVIQSSKKELALPGFSIISACNVRTVPESPADSIGVYHFRGKQTLRGILRIEPSDAGELFFYPSINTKDATYSDSYFRFADESAAEAKLALPDNSDLECVEAPTTLLVTQVSVVRDYGTDFDGTYIVAFKQQQVGSFTPCKK
ncbi:MAG TPA: hypothetical protein VIU93_05945 [Gallionellaceae bacterium]